MTNFPVKSEDRPDPAAYGRRIPQGLGINLLTRNVEDAARFQATILGAKVTYWEEHFAIMTGFGSTWFLHSDWSYRDHEMTGIIADVDARGAGTELRLYGADPDACEGIVRVENRDGQVTWQSP